MAALTLAACSAPLLAAGYWLQHGVDGPLAPATGEIVPPFVSAIAGANRQVRTLVLTMSGGRISYLLLRGGSPQLGDTGLTAEPAAQSALNAAVAGLVAPGGGGAADQSQLLARFDIGFVLMRAPVNGQLASVLDSVAGLTPVSMRPNFDLWRLTDLPSRVSVVEPNGTVAAVPSGPVGVSAAVPTAGGTLELSEPELPPGGGPLTVGRSGLLHDVLSWLEILAFLVAAALALPGVRTAAEMEAAAASALAAELDEQSAEGTDAEGEAAPLAAAAASGRAVRGRTAVRGTAGGAGRHGAGDLGELASGDRPGRDAARRGAALSPDVAEVREVAGVTTRAETFAGTETFAGAETFAGTETFAGAETVAGPEAVDNGARGMAAPRGHTGAHRGADARGDAGARSGPGVRGGARAREEGEEAEPAKGRGRRLNRRGQGRGGQDATRRGDPERDDARRGEGQRGERERAGEQRDLPLQTGERGNDGIAGKTRKLGRKDKGRSGRPDLPSRDGVAAGGAAAVAGPAAGVSPAAAAGSATARAAAASALRPDIDPGSSGSPPGRRAAWPAGQPPSRFLAGPPDARMPPAGYGPSGPGAQPNREDDSLGYDPRAARAATAPRSPSGSPYDEPPSRDPSSAVSSGYGAPSPSGARYQDDAAAAYRPAGYRPDDGYGRGYGDDTGYRDGSAGHTPVRGYAPDPGYGGDRGDGYDRAGAANRADPNHPGGSGYGDDSTHEPGGHLAGPVPRSQPPAAADWQDSGWHDTATSGSRTGHGSGWPEPDKRQGWSQDYQQPSWPQDHPAAGPASGHGSAWPVPEQQPWVDSGEELGALPSAGEVHHDWPGRDDRTGWPTPGREAEGEEW